MKDKIQNTFPNWMQILTSLSQSLPLCVAVTKYQKRSLLETEDWQTSGYRHRSIEPFSWDIHFALLADPGKPRGCSTNTSVINWLIKSESDPLVKISLRRRHSLMVEYGAFSHKIDQVTFFGGDLKSRRASKSNTGSRVTTILLNGWILPTGGASAVESLLSTGLTPSSLFINQVKKQMSHFASSTLTIATGFNLA